MRKWLGKRGRGKKKSAEGSETAATHEPAPPPLQPVLMRDDVPPPSPAPEPTSEHSNVEVEQGPAKESDIEPSAAADASAGSAQPSKRRKRRRGRGGKGRTRPTTRGVPATAAPISGEIPSAATEVEPASPAESHGPPESPPQAVSPAPVHIPHPRKSKGTVVLAIGLPGSGKSTWFRRRGVTPLSTDMIRTLLFDDANQQKFQDLVFSTLRGMLRARLIARMPMNYVDATNLNPHERRSWIKMSRDFGYEVQAVYFDVPLAVCMERNRRRDRVVAEDAMDRLAKKLRPPTFEEGFSKITVVRVKNADSRGESPAQEQVS